MRRSKTQFFDFSPKGANPQPCASAFILHSGSGPQSAGDTRNLDNTVRTPFQCKHCFGKKQCCVNPIFITLCHNNPHAFAALKPDGSVVCWGRPQSGGDSRAVQEQLLTGVTKVFSTSRAFAALKEDGSVVCWGDRAWGGDCCSECWWITLLILLSM